MRNHCFLKGKEGNKALKNEKKREIIAFQKARKEIRLAGYWLPQMGKMEFVLAGGCEKELDRPGGGYHKWGKWSLC